MALTREGISQVRGESERIKQEAAEMKRQVNELRDLINSNPEYQLFKMGTERGNSVDRDLTQTINTTLDMLLPQIDSISQNLDSFCAKQEAQNR